MDDATIEDEIEDEQADRTDQLNNRTTLLPWSTIFQIGQFSSLLFSSSDRFRLLLAVSQQWMIFIIISLIIGVYLYYNAKQRKDQKKFSSSIARDHLQSEQKKPQVSAKRTVKRD